MFFFVLLSYFKFYIFETGRNHIIFEGYNAIPLEVVDQPSYCPDDGHDDDPYDHLDPGAVLLVAMLGSLEITRALALLYSGPEGLSRVCPVSPSTYFAAISSPPFTQQAIWIKFIYKGELFSIHYCQPLEPNPKHKFNHEGELYIAIVKKS